jgi:adenine-specific DNA methylase
VAVLLNKVVLEYIPKYGQRLADEVRKWGEWIKKEAEKELAEFYPKDPDGATPIAYLWARTVLSEAPGEETAPVEIPLLTTLWLAKKSNFKQALRWKRDRNGAIETQRVLATYADGTQRTVRRPVLDIFAPKTDAEVEVATVARGSATCPITGYTTPIGRVREQLKVRRGGSNDSRMTAVVWETANGTEYRLPSESDVKAYRASIDALGRKKSADLPNEPTPDNKGHRAVGSPFIFGMSTWREIFSPRQLLCLSTIVRLIRQSPIPNGELAVATRTCLALGLGKLSDYSSTLSTWRVQRTCVRGTFGRQALGFTWDYGEMNPFAGSAADYVEGTEYIAMVVESIAASVTSGESGAAQLGDAVQHTLPDDAAVLLATDPPYYDSVPFAEIADFFYVWLKRSVPEQLKSLFVERLTPKQQQAIVWHPGSKKEAAEYERKMSLAMRESRRVVTPGGIGVVFFAHKSTAGWESQLASMIEAGWIITGSWPLDTERSGRFNSQGAASLASSVQLVCRPRENPDGTVRDDDVGEWRDVLGTLPKRIHEWMPRLAEEGVVGADAIFACLGPALEIFSRYSRVEKVNGEIVPLADIKDEKGDIITQGYLSHVWAAVSTEALSMIFRDADAAGLEPDARLTAMWLWTLGGGKNGTNGGKPTAEDAEDADEDSPHPDPLPEGEGTGSTRSSAVKSGYVLEFDAARKIAQGLGIHLEKSESIVEVNGATARLLPVAERTQYLFGKDAAAGTTRSSKAKKKVRQKTMFDELGEAEAAEAGWTELKGPPPGTTVLDRLHQAMILFAAGRGELMKRFLLDDGIGSDARFWKLAQSLSALYPSGTEEKRWGDGVLARKKGLGL